MVSESKLLYRLKILCGARSLVAVLLTVGLAALADRLDEISKCAFSSDEGEDLGVSWGMFFFADLGGVNVDAGDVSINDGNSIIDASIRGDVIDRTVEADEDDEDEESCCCVIFDAGEDAAPSWLRDLRPCTFDILYDADEPLWFLYGDDLKTPNEPVTAQQPEVLLGAILWPILKCLSLAMSFRGYCRNLPGRTKLSSISSFMASLWYGTWLPAAASLSILTIQDSSASPQYFYLQKHWWFAWFSVVLLFSSLLYVLATTFELFWTCNEEDEEKKVEDDETASKVKLGTALLGIVIYLVMALIVQDFRLAWPFQFNFGFNFPNYELQGNILFVKIMFALVFVLDVMALMGDAIIAWIRRPDILK